MADPPKYVYLVFDQFLSMHVEVFLDPGTAQRCAEDLNDGQLDHRVVRYEVSNDADV